MCVGMLTMDRGAAYSIYTRRLRQSLMKLRGQLEHSIIIGIYSKGRVYNPKPTCMSKAALCMSIPSLHLLFITGSEVLDTSIYN